jgi:hypothetical protein
MILTCLEMWAYATSADDLLAEQMSCSITRPDLTDQQSSRSSHPHRYITIKPLYKLFGVDSLGQNRSSYKSQHRLLAETRQPVGRGQHQHKACNLASPSAQNTHHHPLRYSSYISHTGANRHTQTHTHTHMPLPACPRPPCTLPEHNPLPAPARFVLTHLIHPLHLQQCSAVTEV